MENVAEFGPGMWAAFGERVRALRKERKGWTQQELAFKMRGYGLEMHQTTIAKMEGGTRPTVVHEIVALAQLLEASYDEILPPTLNVEVDANRAAAMERLARLEQVAHIHRAREDRERISRGKAEAEIAELREEWDI